MSGRIIFVDSSSFLTPRPSLASLPIFSLYFILLFGTDTAPKKFWVSCAKMWAAEEEEEEEKSWHFSDSA